MTILVQDSFNRADNATSLGVAESGQTWVVSSYAWGINSNRAFGSAVDSSAIIDVGVSDCVVSAVVSTVVNGMGLAFRQTTGLNYLVVQYGSDQKHKLYNRTNWTLLATSGVVPVVIGDTLKVVLEGSTIKYYVNSTEVFTVTSTLYQTATKHGIGRGSGAVYYDSFLIESLSTPPSGADGTISLSLNQMIYKDSSSPLSLYQSIYKDIVETLSLTQRVYKEGESILNLVQQYYSDAETFITLSLAQNIYKDSSVDLSLLQKVYKDTQTNLTLLQRMYTTGEINLDLLINIRDDLIVFDKVLRKTLEINRGRKTSLEVKRSHKYTLNI